NTLDGGAGADELIGGAGDDIYIVDNVGDQIVEGSAEGTADEVRATVDYVLSANVENLVLLGTSALNGTGNASSNRITGNAAANILDGGGGSDILVGGHGDDTYIVDGGDTITEMSNQGIDTV